MTKMQTRWYSKLPLDGDFASACVLVEHRSKEPAERAAGEILEDGSEGWPEDVDSIEWGMLVPLAQTKEYEREETPGGEFDYLCKYRLETRPGSVQQVLAALETVGDVDAFDLKRIRVIVDDDAKKRHRNHGGEPSWGVIADCVLAHVSQHRQARESLGVPEQVTLDQYVVELSQHLRDFETSLVTAGKWDPYPELPLNLLAREIVAQAERWRIDAEHYRGEASNATAAMVESLSAEVARLTGEVAATRSEAARQIGARDAELAALVTRAQRLAADLTSEANECTAHGLVSPATALRGAAAFLTSMGERVPRVFSAASSVEALHLRLEEADRHLAGLQEEAKRRDEALREETRKLIEYSNLVDQYKLGLAQVQGASTSKISAALAPSPSGSVQRLDYSKPPPGYTSWGYRGASVGGTLYQAADGEQVGPLKAAWAHYKASNDPSGMWTLYWESEARAPQGFAWGYFAEACRGTAPTQAEARAAAWAWYDRRLALAERVGREVHHVTERLYSGLNVGFPAIRTPLNIWPRCLTWSDDQVASIERWLVDSTAEMPEVLRG